MKLHLPKGLLAAVLAAMTGFTQSAWGETIELKPLINGEWHETSRNNTNSAKQDLTSISIDSTNGTATLGDGWNQNRATHVLTDWIEADETTALTFSVTIGSLTGTDGMSGIAFVGTSQTIALGDLGYDNTKLQYGTSTDVSSDYYLDTGSGWESHYTGGQTTTNNIGDVTIAINTSYTFDGKIVWNANENSYVLSLTLNSAEEPFASVNLGSTADVKKVIVYTDGYGATFSDLTLSGARVSISNLIWTGTDENNIWSSSNSTPWGGNSSTSERTNVEFAQLEEGANNTVVISDSVAAHSVTVNDDYTFQADAEASISVESGITVADGKVLNKAGEGALSIISNITGDVKVSEGSLNVTGIISGDVKVSEGSLDVTGIISGDVSVDGGDLKVSRAGAIAGSKLEITNGTVTAELDAGNSNLSIITDGTAVSISNGGTLHLKGHDMLGWSDQKAPEILLKSTSAAEGELASLIIEETQGKSTTIATKFDLQGNSIISGTKVNMLDGSSIVASGGNNTISISTIQLRDQDLSVTVDDTVVDEQKVAGTLTISSNLENYDSNSRGITKKGSGELILTGTNTYTGGTNIEAGTLTVEGSLSAESAVSVSQGASLKIAGSNDATNGEMLISATGAGNIIVAKNTQIKYVEGETIISGSRVAQMTGKLSVSNGAILTLGNSDLHQRAEEEQAGVDMVASFTEIELDNGTIKVNNPSATLKNVMVTAKGGTIHVEDMGEDRLIDLTGTTQLDGHLTYKLAYGSWGAVEKLTGSGNFVIDASDRFSKGNEASALTISAAENYTGKVQINGDVTDLKLNIADSVNTGVEFGYTKADETQVAASGKVDVSAIAASNSITFRGFSGSMVVDSTSNIANIDNELTLENHAGKAAFELTSGTEGAQYNITSKVTGGGNFIVATSEQMGVTFSGDISGWSGKMEVTNSNQEVTYTGNATVVNNENINVRGNGQSIKVVFDHEKDATVNSAMYDGGKKFDLFVKNTAAEGTTFSNTVDITSATIEAGTKATFTHASVTVDDILVKAAAQLSFSGVESLSVASLETNDGSSVTVGTIENHVGKVLTVTNQATFNGGTINADLKLADGAKVAFNGTVEMGSTLTLGTNLALSGTKLEEIKSLTSASQTVVLFTGVDTLTLGEQSFSMAENQVLTASDNVTLSRYFTTEDDTNLGNYFLGFNAAGDLYAGLVVPEPATTTLSLLALAGLCARRRRKS